MSINRRYYDIFGPHLFTVGASLGILYPTVCKSKKKKDNFPWESIKIIAMTALTGATFGIASDITNRKCVEYLYDKLSLKALEQAFNAQNIKLNPKYLVFGIQIFPWILFTYGGIFLALVARVPFPYLKKIKAHQIAPWLITSAITSFAIAHMKSHAAELELINQNVILYPKIPENLQAPWHACIVRNLTHKAILWKFGVTLGIGILLARRGVFSWCKQKMFGKNNSNEKI